MSVDYALVEVERGLTAREATAMVGDTVPPAEPNVTDATVAVDLDAGGPVYAYLPLGDVAELRRAVLGLPFTGRTTVRANGTRNRSRVFGYAPRRPVYQREGCSPSALKAEAPAGHAVVESFADRLADLLATIDPRVVAAGRDAVAAVAPEWRLGETKLWTSGVINQSSVLPYHRDGFNFPAWSAMPVLRRHLTGGFLRIPEYDATIACRDGWGVFFPGYQLLHGVTPMRLTRPDGYRYSIVYYALRGMKDCFTAAAETAYARRRRTEREQDIAERLAAGESALAEPRKKLPDGCGGGASGMRMFAGRTQDTYNRADTAGDPSALEDAYLADRDGDGS